MPECARICMFLATNTIQVFVIFKFIIFLLVILLAFKIMKKCGMVKSALNEIMKYFEIF